MPPREFVLDELGLGAVTRGATRAPGRRDLKQDLAHLGLVVAQENVRDRHGRSKGIRPCAATAISAVPSPAA